MNFFDKVYETVLKIPKGKVTTYGAIAIMCGRPRAARVVGYALHNNPMPGVIPCHRVLNRKGGLAPAFAFGGLSEQKRLLESEGVTVSDDGFVDLSEFMWVPDLD